MSIFKDCDIRGVYGEDLCETDMAAIGRAAAYLLEGRSIVVGGDFRTHTPSLKAAFVKALLEGGAEVFDIGQVPTPQLYFSKRHLGTYAGAQITASHNPAKYNGLKLMFGELPVRPEDISGIEDLIRKGKSRSGKGILRETDTASAYEQMLLARTRPLTRTIRVVIDAGNGAMSRIAPRVAEAAGAEVIPLFCEPDGTFPGRDPNPAVLTHITALCEKVREERADLGIAFDGDGDRAIFADGNGDPLLAEEAMVIFTDALMQPGDSMVYDLKCSSIVKRAVEKRGGKAVMERSGHAFIRRNFMERGSVIAGEVSGHYFFRELEGDDGLYALMVMLDILEKTGQPIRDLLKDVVYTQITPDLRIRSGEAEIETAMARMEAWAREPGVQAVRIDGIRMEFPDGSWFLLRRSITEPAFTVRFEAADRNRLEEIRKEAGTRLGISIPL